MKATKRHGGRREGSLEPKQGVCGRTAREAGQEESTVSGWEKSGMDPSFWLLRGKLKVK